MYYFKLDPPLIGPIGGGSTFWIFSVIFGPMVTKNVLGKILDTWGSWTIFFDSLFVSGQNKGGQNQNPPKIAFFSQNDQNASQKNYSEIIFNRTPRIVKRKILNDVG